VRGWPRREAPSLTLAHSSKGGQQSSGNMARAPPLCAYSMSYRARTQGQQPMNNPQQGQSGQQMGGQQQP